MSFGATSYRIYQPNFTLPPRFRGYEWIFSGENFYQEAAQVTKLSTILNKILQMSIVTSETLYEELCLLI